MRVIIVTLLVAASAALAYFAPSQPKTADARTPVHPKKPCPPCVHTVAAQDWNGVWRMWVR